VENGHPYDAVPATAIILQAPVIDRNALGYVEGEWNSRCRAAPLSTSRTVSGARIRIGACRLRKRTCHRRRKPLGALPDRLDEHVGICVDACSGRSKRRYPLEGPLTSPRSSRSTGVDARQSSEGGVGSETIRILRPAEAHSAPAVVYASSGGDTSG